MQQLQGEEGRGRESNVAGRGERVIPSGSCRVRASEEWRRRRVEGVGE